MTAKYISSRLLYRDLLSLGFSNGARPSRLAQTWTNRCTAAYPKRVSCIYCTQTDPYLIGRARDSDIYVILR
jgi:hypothetical protein